LLPLFAVIGAFLVIGVVLISSGLLPEESAKEFHALTDVSLQSDMRVIKEPTPEENVFVYAVNDVAEQGLEIAQGDERVKEILDSAREKEAVVTIAAVQPTLLAHRETGELFHSSSGQIVITANWQTVDGILYSEPLTFVQIIGRQVVSHQQIWNVHVDLDENRVTEISQRADRVVSETGKPGMIRADINMFLPNAIVIDSGSAIRWPNPSNLPHNVVGIFNQTAAETPAKIDSGFIDPGESWQYRFENEGVFNYLCTIHSEEGMRGTVIVTSPS
jgi:plastocyanin